MLKFLELQEILLYLYIYNIQHFTTNNSIYYRYIVQQYKGILFKWLFK